MQNVLVAGATGYLGSYVAREFEKKGYRVRALARSAAKLEIIEDCVDEKIIGEVTDPKSIQGSCKGIDIVFSSIGITKQKDHLTYMDVDYQGNKNLLEEAKKERASKFIYVSVFNAEKMKRLKSVQAKIKFEEALKASGMAYTIIYPNGFFSDMLEYLEMARKGKGYVFGSGEKRINPIHGEDLAEICVQAVEGEEKHIHAGGPDVLTHKEILDIAFQCLMKPSRISRVPHWARSSLLAILKVFTSVKTYGPLEFFMTVLAVDMIAPAYGRHHLMDFFMQNQSAAQ